MFCASSQAICAPDKLDRVSEVIREELDLLLKDGITQEELETQSKGLLEQRTLRRTSDRALAGQLATQAYVGRTMEFAENFEEQIRRLTVNDVNAALRRHIDPDRLYIALAGDLEKAEREAARGGEQQ